MNTKFRIYKEYKNVSANKREEVATFDNDNNNRVSFVTGSKAFADIIESAIDVDCDIATWAFNKMPFAEYFTDVDFSAVIDNMSFYDVIREYNDKDAEYKEVNRNANTNGRVFVRVIGEYWKATKRSQQKRGIRILVWFDGENEEDADTYNVCVDTRGHVSLKTYGIGAMWKLAKPILDEHAVQLAMDARAKTNMYTTCTLVLEKLAQGNSVQRNEK